MEVGRDRDDVVKGPQRAAYLAAAVVYLAVRGRLRADRALLAAAGTYVALAGAAAAAMTLALSTM